MRAIGIINVGIGNLGSLAGAVSSLGFDVTLVAGSKAVPGCDALILPGVGSFGHGMAALEAAAMRRPILDHVEAGKPLLGICLGMQMLFDIGEEGCAGDQGGVTVGLGLIPGRVRRLESGCLQLPHVGWNDLAPQRKHPVTQGVKAGVDYYFVHSYCVDCDDDAVVATAEYGETFTAIAGSGPVIGMQFHCEKSQRNGLRLLENFCWWDGTC